MNSEVGKQSILVVEDEEVLRDLVRDVLGEKGYSVQTARDGEEAMSVYTRYQESIGVVLLDLDLPKIPGPDILCKIQQMNPHVKVIIASGYLVECSTFETPGSGANAILQKPYTIDALLTTVRDVLAENMHTQFVNVLGSDAGLSG